MPVGARGGGGGGGQQADGAVSLRQAHPTEVAFEAGFGSLYWMEGVAFRLQVERNLLSCWGCPAPQPS